MECVLVLDPCLVCPLVHQLERRLGLGNRLGLGAQLRMVYVMENHEELELQPCLELVLDLKGLRALGTRYSMGIGLDVELVLQLGRGMEMEHGKVTGCDMVKEHGKEMQHVVEMEYDKEQLHVEE